MGATGTTTIDFGSGVGSDKTTVVITGQGGIVSGSHAEAFFMADSTADHGPDEHMLGGITIQLVCSDIVAGTGFTVNAFMRDGSTVAGQFTIHWVWV